MSPKLNLASTSDSKLGRLIKCGSSLSSRRQAHTFWLVSTTGRGSAARSRSCLECPAANRSVSYDQRLFPRHTLRPSMGRCSINNRFLRLHIVLLYLRSVLVGPFQPVALSAPSLTLRLDPKFWKFNICSLQRISIIGKQGTSTDSVADPWGQTHAEARCSAQAQRNRLSHGTLRPGGAALESVRGHNKPMEVKMLSLCSI